MSADRPVAADAWARLRMGGHEASELEIPTWPTDVETGLGPIRLALGPSGEARLLLPVSESERLHNLKGGRSLQLVSARYAQGRSTLRFIDLMCENSKLEGVFNEVVDEILERVRQGHGCVAACASTLEDFRTLLDPESAEVVDRRQIRGLVGELLYLNRLLELDSNAWKAWRGPLEGGERHDFRLGKMSIEIKTTARVSATRVRISSIDQLAVPTGGTLHLVKLVLEEVGSGDLTISSLARRVLLRSSDLGQTRERLADAGCRDPDAPAWNAAAFQLESEEVYEVRRGFPRIVANSFDAGVTPKGVSHVEYDIDLAMASDFREATEVEIDLARRLVTCL